VLVPCLSPPDRFISIMGFIQFLLTSDGILVILEKNYKPFDLACAAKHGRGALPVEVG